MKIAPATDVLLLERLVPREVGDARQHGPLGQGRQKGPHVAAVAHLCESDVVLDAWRRICRYELIIRGRRG